MFIILDSPMPKVKKDVFLSIQKEFKEEIPKCLIDILKASGFDTAFTLKSIDDGCINEIETFLTANRQLLNTMELPEYYKNAEHFKFLPGHKIFLMQIAQQLQTNVIRTNVIRTNENAIPADQQTVDAAAQIITIENKLIKKMLNYSATRNLCINSENFNRGLIENSNIEISKKIGKCVIKCPICDKKISVVFNKYWFTSNFERHIKQHETGVQNENELNQDIDKENNVMDIGTNDLGLDNMDFLILTDTDDEDHQGNAQKETDSSVDTAKNSATVVKSSAHAFRDSSNQSEASRMVDAKIIDCLNNLNKKSVINQFSFE